MITTEMRKFFGNNSPNPFDWWITPGHALVLLVEDDFDELFARRNLKMVGDSQSVANTRYGILHHHDFLRNDEDARVEPSWEQDIHRNLEKFAHLKKRWDDLSRNEGPVLFVRYTWNIHEPLLGGFSPDDPAGPDQAARLFAALDRKFPQLDYEILFIDAPEVTLEHKKVLYRLSAAFTEPGECLNAADLAWKDNTPIFSRMFSTINLR